MEEKADGRMDGRTDGRMEIWKLIVFLARPTQYQKHLGYVFLMRNDGLQFEAEFRKSMDIPVT
jgi:hypothetical protein